jgi:hypothetical protein
MSRADRIRKPGLALAAGLALCGCFLYKLPPPEQMACQRQAWANRPDLTGQWESNDGVRVDVRHQPSGQGGLLVAIADDTPKHPEWTLEGAYLQAPDMVSLQPPVCGDVWKVRVEKNFPNRAAQPGQFVSQLDRIGGRLVGTDRIELDGGEVWTRVGAVGALRPPKPGANAYDTELEGGVLKTVELATRVDASASECTNLCNADERCAARVQVGARCRLLSSLTGVHLSPGAQSWINPGFDFDPPALPPPGVSQRLRRLRGVELRTVGVSNRAAQRECQRACDEDWSCKGYSVEVWDGTCVMLSSVNGAKRAGDTWYATVQPERVPQLAGDGQYAPDNQLTGTVLRTVNTGSQGLMGCHAECDADDRCRAFNYLKIMDRNSSISSNNECVLLGDLGTPKLAQHWLSYVQPPRPTPPSEPPSQTMSSPLCQGHPDAQPAYAMTTSPIDASTPPWHLDLTELPFRDPARPSFRARADRLADWTSAFFVRPVASGNGNVHLHAWYKADLVLKVVDGEVVVGAADEGSEWRIEHLWEHLEPPNVYGVWYVVRSAETGMFLSARASGIELVGNPSDPSTHWRFNSMVLPTETRKTPTPFPVVEPEPIAFDPVIVEALTSWAVKEYTHDQVPACYKRVDNLSCPSSGQTYDCGAMCTQGLGICVSTIADMVTRVGELAANIAGAVLTGGTANAGMKTARVGGQAAKQGMRMAMKSVGRKLADKVGDKLRQRVIRFILTRGKSEAFKKLAKDVALDIAKKTGKLAAKKAVGAAAEEYLRQEENRRADLVASAYAEEVSRRAAERIALTALAADDPALMEIAKLIDPTGVVAAVDAFVKPMCEEIRMPDVDF